MTFTENSFLVRLYVRKVKEGLSEDEVPNLFNLKEVVTEVLKDIA